MLDARYLNPFWGRLPVASALGPNGPNATNFFGLEAFGLLGSGGSHGKENAVCHSFVLSTTRLMQVETLVYTYTYRGSLSIIFG